MKDRTADESSVLIPAHQPHERRVAFRGRKMPDLGRDEMRREMFREPADGGIGYQRDTPDLAVMTVNESEMADHGAEAFPAGEMRSFDQQSVQRAVQGDERIDRSRQPREIRRCSQAA